MTGTMVTDEKMLGMRMGMTASGIKKFDKTGKALIIKSFDNKVG